jgi:uroporphyrinogen-III synthase
MADDRPLRAKRVLVTRAEEQSGPLMELLRAAGATPVAAPAIQILPPDDDTPLREAVADLARYDWLVCTSANAVRAIGELREQLQLPWPTTLRVAAVGAATARACSELGLTPSFQPTAAVADALGRELPVQDGTRVLWPRSAIAALDLAESLRARGAHVDAPIAYRTVASVGLLGIADALRDRRVDAITFTSPSTVRHFLDGIAAAGAPFHRLPAATRPLIAVIGPVTAAAARECGLAVDGVADPHGDAGLVATLSKLFASRTAPA